MSMLTSLSRLSLAIAAVVGLSVAPIIVGDQVVQAQEKKASERKTRKTPALRAKVYDQLARAQALADEGKTAEAITALDSVKERSRSMNSYELAMMYNFYGFIYYNEEDYANAIKAFEQVVQQQPIPETFEQTTLFSLSQLAMMQGEYAKTLQYLERWESLQNGPIPAKNLVLKAQATYQNKDYQAASRYINEAIELQENSEEGYKVEENWYVLQRAVYYELKQPKKVTEVLEKMVRLFNKPKYWIQLGGMYGELEREKEQLAILESAYQQGYITRGSDMFNLAQLYYYHQVPYKGARLMEQAMEQGLLAKNLRNLKFLAQCWSLAKEDDKAIPVMVAAADLSEDGELHAQLAQTYLNLERFDEAIEASHTALEKGELRNVGITHLVLGMALFNKEKYNDALNQLAEAEKHSSSRRMARQWSKFVESEKASKAAIVAQIAS